MKKVLYFAAGILVLAGCAKVVLNEDNSDPRPIVFNSPVVGVNTKAAMTTYDYDPLVNFDVYALFSNAVSAPTDLTSWADAAAATANEYLTNVTFSQQGESPDWYFGNTGAFWPKQANASLTFHAISPSGVSGVTHNWKTSPYGFTVTDYSVDDNTTAINAANQRDLMFSSIAFGKKQANESKDGEGDEVGGEEGDAGNNFKKYKGIDILFHHALACIQFNAKISAADAANVKYRIKSITITGHTVNGTVNENLDANGTGYSTTTNDLAEVVNSTQYFTNWQDAGSPVTVSADKVLYSVADYAAATDLNTTPANLTVSSPYLVIPQNLANTVTVTITYWEKINSLTEVEITSSPIVLNTLKDSGSNTIAKWQANHRYTYTIIIGRDAIKLDPAVSSWTDIDVNGPRI